MELAPEMLTPALVHDPPGRTAHHCARPTTPARGHRRTGQSVAEFRLRMVPYLERVLAAGEHPWLERIIIEAEDFPDDDVVFERRLGYVLDGLAKRVSEG